MKRASNLSEFSSAFSTQPLAVEDLDAFYCDTLSVRLGDGETPLAKIFRGCTSGLPVPFMLFGHRGCGKSTELARLRQQLEQDNERKVWGIDAQRELRLSNLDAPDILILCADAVLGIAEEVKCDISDTLQKDIKDFWDEHEVISEIVNAKELNAEAGGEGEISLPWLVKFFASIKGKIRLGATTTESIRKNVSKKPELWLALIKELCIRITAKTGGKLPVVIMENLDKADWTAARDLFTKNNVLSRLPFPVIYTVPIGLYYNTDAALLKSDYAWEILPIIKVSDIEGRKEPAGIAAIRNIVEKRADLTLFDDGVLDLMIEKTGGCIRDLFEIIDGVAVYAGDIDKKRSIGRKHAETYLTRKRSELCSMLSGDDYDFLADIYRQENTILRHRIKDSEKTQKMLQCLALLEYNGDRWRDVHPLVADFLVDLLKIVERRKFPDE